MIRSNIRNSGSVSEPGDPPVHLYDPVSAVGKFRLDPDTQTRWHRWPDDATHQLFNLPISDFVAGGAFSEDVYLYGALTHEWTMNLFTTGLADGEGNWAANTDAQDESAVVLFTFTMGHAIDTDLETFFPDFTVVVTVAPGIWLLDISDLVDGDGLALEDLNVFETGPVSNTTILEDADVVTELQTALGAGYQVDIAAGILTITQEANSLVTQALPSLGGGSFVGMGTVSGGTLTHTPTQDQTAEISLSITGPIGRFPFSGDNDWIKTLDGGGTEVFTETTEIDTFASAADPAVEIPSVLGTVEGEATVALDRGDDTWDVVQAVGDPRSSYPQKATDEIKALVGDSSKTLVQPGPAVWPRPTWVTDQVANLPPA